MVSGKGEVGFHRKDEGASLKRVKFKKSDLAMGRPAQPPLCPECGSSRSWKDGKRMNGTIQRYLCRDCGYRFSDMLKDKKPKQHTLVHQVCAGAKNLVTVESRTEKVAGARYWKLFETYIKQMVNDGYKPETIKGYVKLLRTLAKRGAELYAPESVKEVISKQTTWSEGYKERAADAYSSLLNVTGGKWTRPKYKRVEKLPWIPTEQELDQLIAGCSPRIATFLQVMKETGARPGEVWKLTGDDLDLDRRVVNICNPEKRSKPRLLKISHKLVAMLKKIPMKDGYYFKSGKLHHFRGGFRQQRKRMAAKLGNPNINRIQFKTLRHFKGTMLYHQTKDILLVKETLGHKNIKNTLVYTHLVNFQDDDYVSRVVKPGSAGKAAEQAGKLIEAGFEYVCSTPDDYMVFRKRK